MSLPRQRRQIVNGIGRGTVEIAVVALEHFGTERRQAFTPPPAPPGAAVTTGSVKARLMLSSSTQARL
jgi:hypothetical protein